MKRFMVLFVSLFSMLLMLAVSFSFAPGARAATILGSLPNGYGYAGYATIPVGSTIVHSASFGPSAPIWFGCSPLSTTLNDAVSSMSFASLVKAGTALSSVTNNRTATRATIQTHSAVQNVNILSGLITANAIQDTVASTITPTTATSNVIESSFAGLNVAGHSLGASLRPNTRIPLANLGYVVLDEQGTSNGPDATYGGVNMVHVYVTNTNTFGLPAGTEIILATVNSGEQRTGVPAVVGAHSYSFSSSGSTQGIGSLSTPAPAPADIGCAGGTQQNGLSNSSSQVGNTGVVQNSASGKITSSGSTATSRAVVTGVNLLKGLIQVGMITSVANASWNGTGSGSASSTLSDLHVAGLPLLLSPPPNMSIPLPGLGYVVLNEQSGRVSSSGASEQVNGLDIHVTQANSYGLPVGSQIIMAHADAHTTSFG